MASPSYSARHVKRGIHPLGTTIALSSIPFVLTFLLVSVFAWRHLFPLLTGQAAARDSVEPLSRRAPFSLRRLSLSLRTWTRFLAHRAAAITFSVTIGLSAVLAELIFCEISDLLDPAARSLALELTITLLLVSLVVVIPSLEIHAITSATGWRRSGLKKRAAAVAWTMDILGLLAWLAAFWYLGRAVLGSHVGAAPLPAHGLSQGILERIGIIGITLMASLAGFAAVSSLWQTFGLRIRPITDTDIARKEHGLRATSSLLAAKESRLRALERQLGASPTDSTWTARMFGSFRGGNPMSAEQASLRLEISGLELMQFTLANTLRALSARRAAQLQASTPLGRLTLGASHLFALYCLYRIAATTLATFRRWWHPAATFASTDPINRTLALLAKHWDPSLDREAWARQISFLLSGLMLLASFNAVLQTVLLFARLTPARLLPSAQNQLAALLVAQISATYVVSSALLLRSNLPAEMGSVIEGALGAPLDVAFVERWFEGWFLGACGLTAAGIWLGRAVLGRAEWEEELDDEGDVEAGKRS